MCVCTHQWYKKTTCVHHAWSLSQSRLRACALRGLPLYCQLGRWKSEYLEFPAIFCSQRPYLSNPQPDSTSPSRAWTRWKKLSSRTKCNQDNQSKIESGILHNPKGWLVCILPRAMTLWLVPWQRRVRLTQERWMLEESSFYKESPRVQIGRERYPKPGQRLISVLIFEWLPIP